MRCPGQFKGLDNTYSTTPLGSLQGWTQLSIFFRSLHYLEGSLGSKCFYQSLTFYVSQKAIKGSAIVDFLAKRANEEYEPMSFDFLDEDLMAELQIDEEKTFEEDGWKMYFNGVSNALGHGVGVVLISPEGNHCPFTAKLSFECTNNVAEYKACMLGLQAAIEKKIKSLNVYGDSALVICQLNGE